MSLADTEFAEESIEHGFVVNSPRDLPEGVEGHSQVTGNELIRNTLGDFVEGILEAFLSFLEGLGMTGVHKDSILVCWWDLLVETASKELFKRIDAIASEGRQAKVREMW